MACNGYVPRCWFFSTLLPSRESLGVGTVGKFRKVIHAAQSKRSSDSVKPL